MLQIVVYVLSMVILYATDCGICVVDGDTLCYILWYMCCRWGYFMLQIVVYVVSMVTHLVVNGKSFRCRWR